MTTKKGTKGTTILYCEKCDYSCFHQSKYERHLGTAKHKKQHLTTEEQQKNLECICGKKYKERTALYRHKLLCKYKAPEEKITELLLQQQAEQRKRDEEQRKRDEDQRQLLAEHKEQFEVLTDKISGMSLVTNNNTINNTNNTFNLNFFLNTQCKDAIDFNSFLRSIKVDDEDIDRFEKNGYLAGMMNVLERNLYNMRIEDRPIHCTDKKRKTIYYKKENGDWEKDGEKLRMPYLIDHIENVSLGYFEKIYRESGGLGDNDTESPRYKWYIKMTFATTGGDYTSAKINRTRIMELLTEEIYVKVIKKIQV